MRCMTGEFEGLRAQALFLEGRVKELTGDNQNYV